MRLLDTYHYPGELDLPTRSDQLNLHSKICQSTRFRPQYGSRGIGSRISHLRGKIPPARTSRSRTGNTWPRIGLRAYISYFS